MKIETRITIAAPSDQVWKHLINMEAYDEWNPFLRFRGGEIKKGRANPH